MRLMNRIRGAWKARRKTSLRAAHGTGTSVDRQDLIDRHGLRCAAYKAAGGGRAI